MSLSYKDRKPTALNLHPQTSISEAKEAVMLAAQQPGGTQCPCCDQVAALYQRRISAPMAEVLLRLAYEAEQNPYQEWITMADWIDSQAWLCGRSVFGSGDWAKLQYWGLIEREDKQYRITDAGVRFAAGETKVVKTVLVYNGDVVGELPGEWVDIWDVCQGRFNPNEIYTCQSQGVAV